jgi:sterol desaturase/sphingolipid hydroxylase (fatty acid hydroxylase superfamily)
VDTATHLAQLVGARWAGSLPFLLILVGVEMAIPLQTYSLRSRLRGAVFWTIWLAVAALTFEGLIALWGLLGLKPVATLDLGRAFAFAGEAGVWLAAGAALMIGDFLGYWYHRIQHGPLWRFHAVHHAIEELHAVGSYGHFSDELFRVIITVLPMTFLPIAGVAEPKILTALIIIMPAYIHSPIKLHFGPARYFFTDNRFHRIHHSTDRRHYDRNFGTYFTIWDQIFGTAHFPKPDEWPDTGLADVREPRSVGEWLMLPFRYRSRRQTEAERAAT